MINIEKVARHHFEQSPEAFLKKIAAKQLLIPVTHMEPDNRKGRKGVHVFDLAKQIESRADLARKQVEKYRFT